jgi:hypothetical protein
MLGDEGSPEGSIRPGTIRAAGVNPPEKWKNHFVFPGQPHQVLRPKELERGAYFNR